jgi:hypothetical protein
MICIRYECWLARSAPKFGRDLTFSKLIVLEQYSERISKRQYQSCLHVHCCQFNTILVGKKARSFDIKQTLPSFDDKISTKFIYASDCQHRLPHAMTTWTFQ